jgi:hypothetical protein
MRSVMVIALLAPLVLAGCGGGDTKEKTVIVNPPPAQAEPGTTVVTPQPSAPVRVCPPGYATC